MRKNENLAGLRKRLILMSCAPTRARYTGEKVSEILAVERLTRRVEALPWPPAGKKTPNGMTRDQLLASARRCADEFYIDCIREVLEGRF